MSTHTQCTPGTAITPRPSLGRMVANLLIHVFWLWPERIKQRRHLASLDDRMLHDIGLTRSDVAREIIKRPWQG